jgi:hypothetical protein
MLMWYAACRMEPLAVLSWVWVALLPPQLTRSSSSSPACQNQRRCGHTLPSPPGCQRGCMSCRGLTAPGLTVQRLRSWTAARLLSGQHMLRWGGPWDAMHLTGVLLCFQPCCMPHCNQ